MIDYLINKLFEKNTKLDTMIKQFDRKKFTRNLFIFATIYSISKKVKKHEQQINKLELAVKEIKSKGE